MISLQDPSVELRVRALLQEPDLLPRLEPGLAAGERLPLFDGRHRGLRLVHRAPLLAHHQAHARLRAGALLAQTGEIGGPMRKRYCCLSRRLGRHSTILTIGSSPRLCERATLYTVLKLSLTHQIRYN